VRESIPQRKKYDSLLDDLPGAFSGTAGEAREVVRQALAKFREARKKVAEQSRLAKIKAEHDSPARTRRLLKDRLSGVPSSKRNDAGQTLFHDVVAAFAAEFSDSFLQHLLSEAQAEISRRQKRQQHRKHPDKASMSNQTAATAPARQSGPIRVAM